MQFTRSLFLALISAPFLALAQSGPNYFTNTDFSATAGKPVTLTWHPTTSGTVTLVLRSGNSNDLDTIATIVGHTSNSGSYVWTPSASLASASDYSVEIVDDSNPSQVNYSHSFTLTNPNPVASTTSSSASASASSTSATSSASSASSASSSASTTASSSSSSTSASSTSSVSSSSATITSSASRTSSITTSINSSQASGSAAAVLTGTSSQQNAAPRATAMVGMLGFVALGALAL